MLKNIEVTQDLLDYIYAHTQPLHPVQRDILNHNKTLGDIQRMQISEVQGHFLQLIIKINNVKNCLEVGTFTGFSSLTMALALPNGGKLTTLDHDKKISLPQAFLLTALSWISIAVFGCLPFIFSDKAYF